MNYEDIKAHIKNVIVNKVLVEKVCSQVELANKVGVSKQAVAGWINQNSCPDGARMPAICEALNVSIYELLGVGTDSIEAKYLKAINENEELKKIIEKYI